MRLRHCRRAGVPEQLRGWKAGFSLPNPVPMTAGTAAIPLHRRSCKTHPCAPALQPGAVLGTDQAWGDVDQEEQRHCSWSKGCLSSFFFFFAFKLVRIKNLETLFWSHKPSSAWCAKSKLTAFGCSEPWVWRYKTPLNELWILLNYALGKTGVSGQPNYSGLQPNRHFFSAPLEQTWYQGPVPATPKLLRTAPQPPDKPFLPSTPAP